MKFTTINSFRMFLLGLKGFCFAFLVMNLSGCQVMGGGVIPSSEYEIFTPKSAEQRIMKEVKLRWEVREDVAQFCAKSIGMGREQAYITPPVACAVWHVASKECVIVTGTRTNHVALGHEVRHCFEGHFHK
jgi:hypothetical protein